ncbi:lactadherin-like isoform X1 [Clavelina lepadiformis]|uniref:lactadherin-like isoform X1 n=1 Tax=Clavelina lepadiformis TaxID=159417 RepID=UPI00404240AC
MSVWLFVVLSAIAATGRSSDEICISLSRRNQNDHHPSLVHGAPGRRGPPGPPGPKGAFGPPGHCACNPSEIDVLMGQILSLNDTLMTIMRNFLFSLPPQAVEKFKETYCNVGMKDGSLPNDRITASGFAHGGMEPFRGRLDNVVLDGTHGAWASAHPLTTSTWLQVDLESPTYVIGLTTQGRPGTNQYNQFVTSYKISYGNSTTSLQVIQKDGADLVFQGNRDRYSKVTNFFPLPIVARYFRFIAQTWNQHITVRLEYLTC